MKKSLFGKRKYVILESEENTMGAIDRATKNFIKDNEVFADALNGFRFNGRRKVLPEHLSEMDSVQTIVIRNKVGKKKYTQERYRDAVKKVKLPNEDECTVMITGFENQMRTDRSMPVRNMLYDSMSYMIQVNEKSAEHDGISVFPGSEKLIPVMTIVINYGSEPWDEPLSLHELFDTNDRRLLKYIPDYRINLIDPHKMSDEEINRYQTNLREVLYCIKYSSDQEKLDRIVKENNARFEMISLKARNVIESINGINIPKNRKGGYNMCKAIEDMKKDAMDEGIKEGRREGRREGREEGREEGRREGHKEGKEQCTKVMKYLMKNYTEEKSNEDIICEMTEKFDISTEEALGYLESFLED